VEDNEITDNPTDGVLAFEYPNPFQSTTPNPGGGLTFVEYLLELQGESENRPMVEPVPAPPAQPTMPNPCEGVPANPLCP
jgi:hypothetical protein